MSKIRLEPSKRLTEQFEVLKCRVESLLNGKAEGPVVLAFTSCRPSEGVSMVAANFAATLVSERRVLLMDGDLRRPSLHRLFPKAKLKAIEAAADAAASTELTERVHGAAVVSNKGDDLSEPAWRVVRAGNNLDVLLARRTLSDPGRLFEMREFGEFLTYAKQRYDVVILDCPPVYGGSGSTILSSKADGVIMVVEAGRVRREVVQRAVELLEETGAHVLGAVLNKRRYPIPRMFYRML